MKTKGLLFFFFKLYTKVLKDFNALFISQGLPQDKLIDNLKIYFTIQKGAAYIDWQPITAEKPPDIPVAFNIY